MTYPDDLKKALKRLGAALRKRREEAVAADRPPCPEAGVLRAFVEGRLAAEKRDEVARHLASCTSCARELVAWDEVARRDEKTAPAGETPGPARKRTYSPLSAYWFRARPLAYAAALAAAAVILFALIAPPFFGPYRRPVIENLKLVTASGSVRSVEAIFSPREQLNLRLAVPYRAYVYVIALWDGQCRMVYPEGPPQARQGVLLIPEKGAWQDFEPGNYMLLVGVRPDVMPGEQAAKLLHALKNASDPREAAKPFFSDLRSVSFTVR